MAGSSKRTAGRGDDKSPAPAATRSRAANAEPDDTPPSPTRPAKRRDTGKGKAPAGESPALSESSAEEAESSDVSYATDTDTDDSAIDWEDVSLERTPLHTTAAPDVRETLELVLNDAATRRAAGPTQRRVTAQERRLRLEVHKLHLLCLAFHVSLRSRWCNDAAVREGVRGVLPGRAWRLLHHDPADQQYRRGRLFLEGLEIAAVEFARRFRVTHRGMCAARWREYEELETWKCPRDVEPAVGREQLRRAAATLSGSRDTGAALFCALLRGAGITARLVASLQVLPFTFREDRRRAAAEHPPDPAAATPPPPARPRPSLRRPHLRTLPPPPPRATSPSTAATAPESPFPVFWTEAFSPATQRWIPVDPLVTRTLNKPHKLHPPSADTLNRLHYALAFDADHHATDVTLRYTPHFTAKTRPHRVTATKHGEQWYRRLLRRFHRGWSLDRDQIEAAELAQKQLSEPIPRNIADFKSHPLFALERHLRRHEVLHPKRAVGVLATKAGAEPIYRREDVRAVKSAAGWYREGRVVRAGELPAKFAAAPRRPRGRDEEPPPEDRALFRRDQTELYVPPPVQAGLVPRNRFGNVDLFVREMLPAGGAHVADAEAARAAEVLGVDYARAVTGFRWERRAAGAVVEGVVVAAEYEEAVRAVCEGLRWEAVREEWERRREEAVERWARWVMRLRVRERLGMGGEGRGAGRRGEEEGSGEEEGEEEGGFPRDVHHDVEMAGGFLPEDTPADSSAGQQAAHGFEDTAGGFLPPEHDDTAGGFLPDSSGGQHHAGGGFLPPEYDDTAAGFLPDDAGGFLPATPPPQQEPSPEDNNHPDFLPNDAGGFLPPSPPLQTTALTASSSEQERKPEAGEEEEDAESVLSADSDFIMDEDYV